MRDPFLQGIHVVLVVSLHAFHLTRTISLQGFIFLSPNWGGRVVLGYEYFGH